MPPKKYDFRLAWYRTDFFLSCRKIIRSMNFHQKDFHLNEKVELNMDYIFPIIRTHWRCFYLVFVIEITLYALKLCIIFIVDLISYNIYYYFSPFIIVCIKQRGTQFFLLKLLVCLLHFNPVLQSNNSTDFIDPTNDRKRIRRFNLNDIQFLLIRSFVTFLLKFY